MGLKNRIRGFIKEDRPLKLKSYISSHDVDLDSLNFGRGQRALHLCALYGSGEMLRCLLRLECDAAAVDKDGNLPLHLALQRALHGHQAEAENLLHDLVRPLQQAYPLGQDVENRHCETGHDMLISLRHKIKMYNQSKEQQRREAEKSSEEENERWRRRLEEESLFEYAEQLPRYSADDDDDHGVTLPQAII
ncbi:nuclear factor of kappa light polypeptide gene enhancer in b-cells inhibitor-like 1 [Plakobranchus ocellatus]|uniref:NF-kappa-B inhibitor-like protein 1 n=1 Tax=Plakobranchus ocellatus TaxID=259542 RepID=A0AAV4D6Z7_9GAST|nr:nuclear factor of kappa light polypeptide gene enhancer in b-cells inhibitor-like 1 [Plakobranchus ocellatus]